MSLCGATAAASLTGFRLHCVQPSCLPGSPPCLPSPAPARILQCSSHIRACDPDKNGQERFTGPSVLVFPNADCSALSLATVCGGCTNNGCYYEHTIAVTQPPALVWDNMLLRKYLKLIYCLATHHTALPIKFTVNQNL